MPFGYEDRHVLRRSPYIRFGAVISPGAHSPRRPFRANLQMPDNASKPSLARRCPVAAQLAILAKSTLRASIDLQHRVCNNGKLSRNQLETMAASKSAPTPDWESVLLTKRARAHFEECFLPRYKQLLASIDQTALTVLVWGPGPSVSKIGGRRRIAPGSALYQKRVQIRGELRLKGITALFSEEVTAVATAGVHSLGAHELAQAEAADLIVVLQCSVGSTAEVHDFGRLGNTIASKLLVFVDEQALAGYSYGALLKSMQERFNNIRSYKYPSDITECHLLGDVLKQVTLIREAKWINSHG
jgi:hypothetical protein